MAQVDIVLINRNMGETIAEAIQSVINQTFTDWRLVIADGGSTDNSMDVIKSFNDSRITLVHSTELPQQRLNTVFRGMNSPYLVYLASDDKLEPTFLAENVQILVDNPTIDVVYNSYIVHKFNANMEELGTKKQKLFTPEQGNLNDCYYMGVFWMFKRHLIENTGGFDCPLGCAYDYIFALRCEKVGAKFYYLDSELGWYRLWSKSDSGGTLSPQRLWRMGSDTRDYFRGKI